MATGLLLVYLGESRKFIQYTQSAPKTYVATIRFGIETETDDAWGRVRAYRYPIAPPEERLTEALSTFIGEFEQYPPCYSAVRQDGRRLYHYARAGESVAIKPRQVFVDDIRLLAMNEDRITVRIDCQPGFYVRSFARDLGRRLGCLGHVVTLRRTHIGDFSVKQAQSFDQIEKNGIALCDIEQALCGYESLSLPLAQVQALGHGRGFRIDDMIGDEEPPADKTYKVLCYHDGRIRFAGVVDIRSREIFREKMLSWTRA